MKKPEKLGLITSILLHQEFLRQWKKLDGMARIVHRMKTQEIEEKGQIIDKEV